MNNRPRRLLRQIVNQFGTQVCEQPKRLRAMLVDVCPSDRAEIAAIIAAAEFGVAKKISENSCNEPEETLVPRLQQFLVQSAALQEGAARWSIYTWAAAFDVTYSYESQISPPPQQQPDEDIVNTTLAPPSDSRPPEEPAEGVWSRFFKPIGAWLACAAATVGVGASIKTFSRKPPMAPVPVVRPGSPHGPIGDRAPGIAVPKKISVPMPTPTDWVRGIGIALHKNPPNPVTNPLGSNGGGGLPLPKNQATDAPPDDSAPVVYAEYNSFTGRQVTAKIEFGRLHFGDAKLAVAHAAWGGRSELHFPTNQFNGGGHLTYIIDLSDEQFATATAVLLTEKGDRRRVLFQRATSK